MMTRHIPQALHRPQVQEGQPRLRQRVPKCIAVQLRKQPRLLLRGGGDFKGQPSRQRRGPRHQQRAFLSRPLVVPHGQRTG